MTPKEKADELVKKMYKVMSDSVSDVTLYFSKQCALIAVDEILKAYPHTYDIETEYTNDGDDIIVIKNIRSNNQYWREVKQEIEKQ